jgi:hypothetical protein
MWGEDMAKHQKREAEEEKLPTIHQGFHQKTKGEKTRSNLLLSFYALVYVTTLKPQHSWKLLHGSDQFLQLILNDLPFHC